MQVAALPLPPVRGRLQTAVVAFLRTVPTASFQDIYRGTGRPNADSLHNALSRLSTRGHIAHPSHDCYQAKPAQAMATVLIVSAALDELERAYATELSGELHARGWER